MSAVEFTQHYSVYHGRKERAAVVHFAGREFKLGLADTARCVRSEEFASALIDNLCQRVGVDNIIGAGAELTAHCRLITKFKERKPRY